MIALTAAGCTRAIEMPLSNLDADAQSHESHLISMSNGTKYAVDRYSTTDSTIVIVKLNLADDRYKRVDLPIVLDRQEVKSFKKLELDEGKSFLLVAPIGLFVLLVVGLAVDPPHID